MVLRYTEMQSTLKVEIQGALTLTAGPDDIKIIDLTAAPYARGFHYIALVIQNAALTGVASLTVAGNTAANGSGTDTVLATMSLPIDADGEHVLEVTHELMSQFSDRAAAGTDFKSLVFAIDGTSTDTIDTVTVSRLMVEEDGLTPADVTTVT
jgi:hypothetical protein